MSIFAFVPRECPACGKEFQALDIWPEDIKCGPCQTAAYKAEIAAINAGRPYVVETIGGCCPTQSTGRTGDDRPFYFRARHGEWALHLGLAGWPTDYPDWPDDDYPFDHFIIAEGDDPSCGFMSNAEVLEVLDRHLGEVRD